MSKKDILNRKKKVLEAQRKDKKERDKADIILSLNIEWDDDKVFKFNRLIENATNGKIKMDYTEKELKLMLLEHNKDLFTDNEYERYLEYSSKTKTANQKRKI